MNTQEKWNFIVERHGTNFSKPENVVQKEWEDMFSELFDYKKLLGEIDPCSLQKKGHGIPCRIFKTN